MAYLTAPCNFMTCLAVSQTYLRACDVILLTETMAAYIANALFPYHQISYVPASRPGALDEGIAVALTKQHTYYIQDWAADETSLWVKIRFLYTCVTTPRFLQGCVMCLLLAHIVWGTTELIANLNPWLAKFQMQKCKAMCYLLVHMWMRWMKVLLGSTMAGPKVPKALPLNFKICSA